MKDFVSPEERKGKQWKDAEITEEPWVLGHTSNSMADPGPEASLSRNFMYFVMLPTGVPEVL